MNKFKYYILLLNNYKIIRQIKWFLALFALLWIKIKRIIKRDCSKKKKRLFATTGNFSLINALTIIKQLNEENCEDYLIINSHQGNYSFWINNYNIAKLHNFKKIKFFAKCRYMTDLRLTCWESFDEIYTLNIGSCFEPVVQMYPDAEINLFDESSAGVLGDNSIIESIKNLKSIYMHKFLGKVDNLHFSERITKKIVPPNIDIFRQISNDIAKQYPITTKYNTEDKNILYCAIFWKGSGLTEEEFTNELQKQIDDLIQAGYKILFKPHPREMKRYGLDKNPNIAFIDSVMPVELYNWDVLAVTGMNCTTLIQMPHYHSIPAFSNILSKTCVRKDQPHITNLTRYFIKEYTPDYKELLKLDVKNTSREELKKQIKKIYDDFLQEKPLLSQNKNVKEFSKKYGSC